jgi:hypothetical protein
MGFFSRAPEPHAAKATVLHAGGLVAIVGESHYQGALRRVASSATGPEPFLDDLTDRALKVAEKECGERKWFRAVLYRELSNPYDRNAVAIEAAGGIGKVGYLDRDTALEYQPVFKALHADGCDVATCPAFLIGGTKEKPSYGVMLCLSDPDRVIADLAPNLRTGPPHDFR